MATIDKLDIGIYMQYARRSEMVEKINQQYHLYEAGSIPPQITLFDLSPRLSEFDMLLGVVSVLTPWAYFFPPKNFTERRKSPFTFASVLPELLSGPNGSHNVEAIIAKIQSVPCKTPEERAEQTALISFLKQGGKINEWLTHVIKQIGRFISS